MLSNNNIYLDFSDVLIKPCNTSIHSRKDINLCRNIKFPISKQEWEGVPIIAANMDTIGTYEVYKVLSKFKIITCFHKFYNVEDLEKMELDSNYFMISTGINDNDLIRLENITNKIDVKFICVDVANGYMDNLISFCKNLRDKYPNKIIIAGNVVCGHRTKELIKYGKVDIVKVGIGSGCFEANTRILMSNGIYKNIIDIEEGDKVINKNGKSVKVLNKIYKGKKNVIKIKSNSFNQETIVTPDHKYWIGDLSYLKLNTIKKSSVTKLYEKNKFEDKNKWEEIDKINNNKQFNLLPKKIDWDLPLNLKIDFVNFKNKNYLHDENNIFIDDKAYNRYIICDYNFGLFIGNYLHNINLIGNKKRYINNIKISEKLNLHESLIENFLISIEKSLPEKYYNKNIQFISGLYEGLLNINENEKKNKKYSSTISKDLFELFYFCIFNLGYGFKVNSNNKKIFIDEDNTTQKFFINKIKKINKIDDLVDTFDLEIDSECHSFIANNSIVHNSACLTRTQTGIGVPQFSAIDECSKAAHDVNGYIIGDGGITCSGDISKGFGIGSDFIMLGGLLSGHDENPGDIIEENNNKFKIFYGMSSKTSMEKNYGKMNNYRSSEGRTLKIPYKGKIEDTIENLLGGVRSTCTYVNAKEIKELSEKSIFIRVNNQINKIYEKFS